jgi:hypothetical protein
MHFSQANLKTGTAIIQIVQIVIKRHNSLVMTKHVLHFRIIQSPTLATPK